MTKLEQLLWWLNGKKAVLLAVASAINSYAVSTSIIAPELGSLIQTLLSIVFGGAAIATQQAVVKGTRLGKAIKTDMANQ